MTEMVTGTPAIVGFTNGNDYDRNRGWDHGAYSYARSVDAGEQTRDILKDVRENALFLRESIYGSTVAIEKTGAANSLAIEKTGAAGILEAAKNMAALNLQAALNASEIRIQADKNAAAAALAAAQNHAALQAQIAECCCELKEVNREIEANRVRDQLQQLQTQVLVLSGGFVGGPAALRQNAA